MFPRNSNNNNNNNTTNNNDNNNNVYAVVAAAAAAAVAAVATIGSIGFDGGRTLVRSLNYWTLPRALGLNNCMLESRARAGDCFDPLYPTGK